MFDLLHNSDRELLNQSVSFTPDIWVQVLGGRLAEVYGTKKVFGISNLLVAALALFTPLLAEVDVWCVILVRLLQVGPTLLHHTDTVSGQCSGISGVLRLPLPPHHGQQVGPGGREVRLHLLCLRGRDVRVSDHQPHLWPDHRPPGLGGQTQHCSVSSPQLSLSRPSST